MRRTLFFLLILLALAPRIFAAGKAEHIVVMVWDGLRPDSVNESNTPTLFKLARDGVFFQNHHAVYPSSTEVNGVAIATGVYPNRSGIFANHEYRPEINPLKETAVESFDAVRKGDEISHNRYLQVPTLAEILQRAGRKTAIAGTKPVVLLHDRLEQNRPCADCLDVFPGRTIPSSATARVFLPLVSSEAPNIRKDEATTRTMTGPLWEADVPTFSLLWLSEPDFSQHATGPGSPTSLQAIKSDDDNLARVLKELETRGVRDKTDVFVMSDHGFSTILRTVKLDQALRTAGFNAVREFKEPPKNGDVLVVGSGGSVLLYVIGHDPKLVLQLVEFLQQQDFVGVIFTREPMQSTFTLDQVRINTSHTPDIVIAMRWSPAASSTGVSGLMMSEGGTVGNHASLSPFEMRATLVAAGPDFRHGMVNQLPSGNTDLAPTILHLLGIEPPQPLDGRVLAEAFTSGTTNLPAIEMRTLEASHEFGNVIWHQYLRVTEFSHAIYFDEGNGYVTPK